MKEKKLTHIEGLEDFIGYTINIYGEIKSYHKRGTNRKYGSIDWGGTPKILRPSIKSSGYRHLGLYPENGGVRYFMVHRLLAMAFIPNPDNLEQVNHKDGNKLNNSIENLEWVTRSDNVRHAFSIGLQCHKRNNIVKPVNQYDLSGTFIRKHESITEAVEYIGLKPSSKSAISRVCNGKQKTCAGYLWKFSESDQRFND